MKNFLIRLFIQLPLHLIWLISLFTLLIPLIYWLITGKHYGELLDLIPETY